MTEQQPENPAAGTPPNATPDPTAVEGAPGSAEETRAPGTAAETRARGSAAVPPPVPKQAWWSRRRTQAAADEPPPPADPWADSEDWSTTPAVDPWADQDTPWQAEIPFPEAMPPTRIDSPLPPTRMQAQLPPTRSEPPLPPSRSEAPLPPARSEAPLPPTRVQPPAGSPPAGNPVPAPPPASAGTTPPAGDPPQRRRWGRKNRAKQTPEPPANRLPVQPRPPAPSPWVPPAASGPAQQRPLPPPPVPQRATQQRPVQQRPAPGWPGQSGPAGKGPPPPPRRKRRWPRRLAMFTLLSAVCCCGVPAYLAWPAAQQYPVSAALPQSVADLALRDDGASRRAVEKLSEQLSGTSLVQGDVFAGVYADGDGKRVTMFGTTGLRLTPESDVEAEITHLSSEYAIKDIQSYDLGETGVHERCGVGRSGGKAVVVCAWADHGSLATVLMTRRSVEESADLTGVLRNAVLTRG
ncbi:hypothetical protein ACWEOZ_23430 [Actinoplanes sp. NPDC004185]